MVSVRELYCKGLSYLEKSGIEAPKLDARVILEFVLGADKGTAPIYYNKNADDEICIKYMDLIKKRAEHMPCSYITGKKEFMALDFFVKQGVLIPRVETENLCEYCIERINKVKGDVKVADICSGSGCIGLSVANYCRNSLVTLYDISSDAIEVSEKNKKDLDIKNAKIIKKDILAESLHEEYDCIISNPPYIPADDIDDVMEEVRDYEPKIALTDGLDGMTFYKRLAQISESCLKKGGFMAVEIGINMHNDVKNIFEKYGETTVIKDDFGIERIVVLNKV